MWEFKRTYSCEWFIGDVVSDDALKGGQNTTDMGAAYDMENWKTTPRNELLHDFYQSNYLGISRCNLALTYIPAMKLDTAFSFKEREEMLGQAYFLRAYYYFRLVRVFGGTPLVTTVLDTNDKWQQPRATAAAIFDQITADLKEAQRRCRSRQPQPQHQLCGHVLRPRRRAHDAGDRPARAGRRTLGAVCRKHAPRIYRHRARHAAAKQ